MTADHLYNLLPALYRLRDAEAGRRLTGADTDGPLRALLTLVAGQVSVLEEDLAQLYDDQFIETCAEWAVPYIGDLVGAQGLTVFPNARFSQRGQVANTLRYRRRKGTAAVIEQLARDVTGWDASVVEFFQQLATTQYLNHLRPENRSMASVRQAAQLERVGTPFDPLPRTADVRRIETGRGRYNIPNIGVFLWRTGSYPLTNAPAYQVDARRFCFDALGRDLPLYNNPVVDEEITHLAQSVNVPMPFTRRSLADTLATHYAPQASLFVWANGAPVALADVRVCDLSGWANVPANHVAIDPVLGRLAFPTADAPPANVRVSYRYGFSTDMGGGEYGRRAATFFTAMPPPPLVAVTATGPTALQDALDQLVATGGIVEIRDNDTYVETPTIHVPNGLTIELRAASGFRPLLALGGALTVIGGTSSAFIINGLLLSGGQIDVPRQGVGGVPNTLGSLHIQHCTLPPGPAPAIVTPLGNRAAQPDQPRLTVGAAGCAVDISDTIMGSLRLTDEATLALANSLLDAGGSRHIALTGLIAAGPDTDFDINQPGAALTVRNSTIMGKVHTRELSASNTIFLADLAAGDNWPGPVMASRRQQGCVRFSYVPPGSQVPVPYRCQPADATDVARVRPVFTSLRCGEAGYGQLSNRCATAISEGADDGAEMGVFHDLYQPQRLANLRTRLAEYLRFSLEAGIVKA